MKIYVDKNALQDYTTKLIAKEKTIFATKDQVGSPLVASTVAGMTDHDKIYVYVGSETGYTSGNWYYWDGSAWVSGGIYNSEGFVLDDTLTSATLPAQAKAVGDKVNQLSEEINDNLDYIYNNDSLFDGVNLGEADINWTVGFISPTTGELKPGLPNGSTYMIYSELLTCDNDIEVKALDGHAVRYFKYNKSTGEYISAINNQTPPITITLNAGYSYRVQYSVVSGATQEQAEAAISAISTHLKVSIPVYSAPITPEKLESLGVVVDHPITWEVGYVNPTTGEFNKGGSTGGNYHVVSSPIKTEYGFNVLSTKNVRWFRYTKSTGVYETGVAWQTAPIDHDFSGDYIWRIQVLGGTSSEAQDTADNISDYVTVTNAKESDAGWITFLPITDVYIGDVQQRIYFNELARYEEGAGYFKVDVSGATYPEVTYTDRYIEFNVTANKDITLTITYYYRDFPAESKALTAHCTITAFANKNVMFLGDSYTANGGMVKWFKDHNNNAVTLYGTRSTTIDDVTYLHEGRGGWTAANYISSASKDGVTNPFYNPTTETFDFAYYMAHDGSEFTDVDIVNILLGRNSGFPVSNMDNLNIIVASIKAYNPNIMVVLMCDNNLAADNSGAGAYLQNVHTANKQSHIYNAAFYDRYKDSTDVVMCFANLNLDNVYDYETEEVDSSITNSVKVKRYVDNVHPWNIPGLGKFGIALNGLLRNILN